MKTDITQVITYLEARRSQMATFSERYETGNVVLDTWSRGFFDGLRVAYEVASRWYQHDIDHFQYELERDLDALEEQTKVKRVREELAKVI